MRKSIPAGPNSKVLGCHLLGLEGMKWQGGSQLRGLGGAQVGQVQGSCPRSTAVSSRPVEGVAPGGPVFEASI